MDEENPKNSSKLKNNKKLSWSDLRSAVTDLRRKLSSLSSMVPTSISFRQIPDDRTRIYFLSTPQNSRESTLLYTDVGNTTTCNNSGNCKLQWQPVIEANFPSLPTGNKYSREEQLLWERKRLATWGITSYELHSDSGKLVFPAASSLFQCRDTGYAAGPLFPTEIRTSSTGAKLNPQICPTNPDLVAYVCNNDIWVSHTISGFTKRMTFAHKGGRSLADDPLSAGVPSYVMQEEFSRYQGYWWQPATSDDAFRIVYEEVDDSDVEIFCFPSSYTYDGEVEEFRFPRAGASNSKSNLKMIQFQLNSSLQIVNVAILELQFTLAMLFPWMEYLVRVGWTPDGKYVWSQLLDRKQQRLDLVLISIDNFAEPPPNLYDGINRIPNGPNPIVQVIYTQQSLLWINIHDVLYFLPSSDPNEIKFIWASEESGYRHLYLITSHIANVNNGINDDQTPMDCMYLQPKVLQKLALTTGEWEVVGQPLWVDMAHELVYFIGLRECPLEKQLYCVSFRKPGEVRLLTVPGSSYAAEFNQDCSILVTVFSNVRKLPGCQIFHVTHTDWTVEGVHITPIGCLLESQTPEEVLCPDLYPYKISTGHILYAMIFKPHNCQPGKKYPSVLHVYGGPEVQLVSNTFKGMRQLRMHMLAAQGYYVIAIDSRGSQHRGQLFESYLRCRMGTFELDDQVEVLQWLARRVPGIDMDRLAIHGWSYGGYLSLMGLIHYQNIFKLAIAGAPVTNWSLYDTGYTERYMDLPHHNEQGYTAGSVLSHVHKFPDEENRLLIIHGLIDENVHFYHTSQLISSLVKAGKPYQLQIYPNERHSLRHLDASKHYETMLLSFLQNYL